MRHWDDIVAGVIVGYARTSTNDQKAGLEAQIEELKAAGCEKIFFEQVSSVDAVRQPSNSSVRAILSSALVQIGWREARQNF